MTNEQLTEYLYDEIRDLNRLNSYDELIIDAYKEEIIRLKALLAEETWEVKSKKMQEQLHDAMEGDWK